MEEKTKPVDISTITDPVELEQYKTKMFAENEKLIYKVINDFKLEKYVNDYYDLGLIGFCKALNTWKDNKIKFSTWAYVLIKNEIINHMSDRRSNHDLLNNELIQSKNVSMFSDYEDNCDLDIEHSEVLNVIDENEPLDRLISNEDYEIVNNLLADESLFIPRNKEIFKKVYGWQCPIEDISEIAHDYQISNVNVYKIAQQVIKTLTSEVQELKRMGKVL